MSLLRHVSRRSVIGEQLLADCLIFKADLEAAAAQCQVTDDITQQTLKTYVKAQQIILSQV